MFVWLDIDLLNDVKIEEWKVFFFFCLLIWWYIVGGKYKI